MGMHIYQSNGAITSGESDAVSEVMRHLPKTELFKTLFPNVSGIEAIYANQNGGRETTLYVIDKKGRLHSKKLDQGTDKKIQESAQVLLGKKREAPDFSPPPVQPTSVEEPAELLPSPHSPKQRISHEVPAREEVPLESSPQPPVADEPTANPLEEQVQKLERELKKEMKELTEARVSIDSLKAELKSHTAQRASEKTNEETWKRNGLKVFHKHENQLQILTLDLEKRTELLRKLCINLQTATARIDTLQARVDQLDPQVAQLVHLARALAPAGAAAAAPAAPAAAAASGQAASPAPATAVLEDPRVDGLALAVPQLQAELAQLRDALREQAAQQEQDAENLIAQQRALDDRIHQAAAGEDQTILELQRRIEELRAAVARLEGKAPRNRRQNRAEARVWRRQD